MRVALLAGLLLALPVPLHAAGATMLVTGYDEVGTTADGTPTGPGVAACPAWMPFDTVVTLEGVGEVVCHDRYRADLSDRIDVWEPTDAACFALTGYYEARW